MDDDGEENDGDAHVGRAESLADEPIYSHKDVEKRLVDIGDKEGLH